MSAESRFERRVSQRGSWVVSIAVLATIAIPLAGLSEFVDGSTWWFAAMGLATLCVGASWAVRAFGLPSWLGVVVACAVWIVTSSVAFAPGTAVLGLIPTPATIDTLLAGFTSAGAEIQSQTIPANPVASLVQLIAMAVGLLAVLADTAVVTRFPAFVGLIAVAVFAVPYAVQSRDLDTLRFAATTVSFLVLLWLTARRGKTRGHNRTTPVKPGRAPITALALGSGAVVLGLIIPAVTPGLTATAFNDASSSGRFPSVYGAGIDPVIQLGRDLRRGAPILSLSYVTTAKKPVYLKMVDLSDFSTGTWQPDAAPQSVPDNTIEQLADPAGLSDAVERTSVTSSISIEALRSEWLPLPYPATTLTNAGRGWSADPETGVVTLPTNRNDSRGDDYTVESLVLTPSAEQLAGAGSDVPASLDPELELPSDLPGIVASVAREVTASADTNYDRAIALQAYFTSGQFEYSTETPVDGGFDGSNATALATFLEVKSGYCVHFAAAMATMARVLGIPARIAVGYFPSSAASSYVDGEPRYEVMTDQLHSWPELYFEGIGWLPFEPTPSLGISVPEYTLPSYAQQAAAPQGTAPTSEAVAPTPKARDDTGASSTANAGTTSNGDSLRGWITTLIVVLVIVAAGLLPAVIRQWRRRRTLAAIQTSSHPATRAWHELQDFARDYGIDVSQGDTPAAFAGRLDALRRVAHKDIEYLRSTVESEQFAMVGSTTASVPARAAIGVALTNIERSIANEVDSSVRRRARFIPTSLFVRGGRS